MASNSQHSVARTALSMAAAAGAVFTLVKLCGARITITIGAEANNNNGQTVVPTPKQQNTVADSFCVAHPTCRAYSTASDYLAKDSAAETEDDGSSDSPQLRRYESKHKFTGCTVQGAHMDAAVEEAREGLRKGEGGPFGCCIVRDGKVVARAHNMVLQTNDPTAHAEVTCIRKASSRLGRFDLSDCVLYTSCEPCPMCFGAIHWAKIPVCVYAADRNDAAKAGFDDAFIYDAIKGTAEEEHVKLVRCPCTGAVEVFGQTFDAY